MKLKKNAFLVAKEEEKRLAYQENFRESRQGETLF